MNRNKVLFYFFSIALLFSCSENSDQKLTPVNEGITSYDTVFPGDYFPAYPGSEWIYTDNFNKTIIASTNPEWIRIEFSTCVASDRYGCTKYETDTILIGTSYKYPISTIQIQYSELDQYHPLNSSIACIGYKRHGSKNCISLSDQMITMFCDTCSEDDIIGYSFGCTDYSSYASRLIKKDTTIEIDNKIYNPVILINKQLVIKKSPSDPLDSAEYRNLVETYYCKDIGIIKEIYFENDSSILYEYSIKDYTINK